MKKIVLSVAIIATSFTTVAQVGVGTTAPKATLDVVGDAATAATADGVIPPRLTADQLIAKTGYTADQTGAIVYVSLAPTVATTASTANVTDKGYYFFDGTEWLSLDARGSGTGDGNNGAGNAGIGDTYGEVASTTGKVWLDRNLGATSNDPTSKDSYGDLYQWGRAADGHQVVTRTNGDNSDPVTTVYTAGLASTWIADEGTNAWDGLFIQNPASPSDWLTTANDNLWSGISAENNPCPSGFRLPTNAELLQERLSWGTGNYNASGASNSPLGLPLAGFRSHSTGTLSTVGTRGLYWSSTVSGTSARYLYFESSTASMSTTNRARGFSVRCLKE